MKTKNSKSQIPNSKFQGSHLGLGAWGLGLSYFFFLFSFFLGIWNLGLGTCLCAQTTLNFNVFLRSNFGTDTMWDGNEIRVFGMTSLLSEYPKIPAKTLYCNEGDTVILNALSISQTDHHTIHLHGLDVDTRNDGDPMTSFSLEHMQDTTYAFVAKHAGTYLYHCHVGDVVHVQMGMYGLIVVRAANGANTAYTNGPTFNKAYNWILSEVDKFWHDTIPVHDPQTDTIHLPPYKPDYFLINGKSETQIPNNDSIKISGAQNDFIYLRVGAIGFFTNKIIFPSFLNAKIIDSDGRPLPSEIISDTLEIAPGERYGVLLNPSAQLTSIIEVQFINMNTDSIWNSQFVPVNISGFSSENELQISDFRVEVFPNPNDGTFQLSVISERLSVGILKISNFLGKEVYRLPITDYRLPITINSNFPNGIYFCTLVSEEGISETRKIIIQR